MKKHRTRPWQPLGAAGGLALGGLLLFALTFWIVRQAAVAPPPPSTATVASGYVANATCLACHAPQAKAWASSHHARAMALATPSSVLGDFDEARFEHDGVATRFFRRDGRYFVNTPGPDGQPDDFEVAYTIGVDPLQQYLVALPGGRLQALLVAWDVAGRRWFQLQPDLKVAPGDALHWTGLAYTANTMCIGCHTTDFEKGYDPATGGFASRWREDNVSCQSCHGPGAAHVAWSRNRSAAAREGPRFGLAADFARMDPHAQVDTCAMCHSRRAELTGSFTAGQPFMDQFRPSDLSAGLYHADGQQLDEVYAYGSFRQSRMYRLGVTCTDCHDAHTGRPRAEGNALCTRCHLPEGDRRFPSAAGLYDSPAHHHHPAGSAGAQCVACHMPATTYMGVHARPDHSLRRPRPDLTATLGTPNACNACHADRPADALAADVDRWFGDRGKRDAGFAAAVTAGRRGAPAAVSPLARLANDEEAAAIVRATALDLLRGYGAAAVAPAKEALHDADPAVRRAAVAALEGAPEATRLAALSPLLADPVRAVRIEAARVLAALPAGRLTEETWPVFERALAEYVAVQEATLDMPGAHLNLAVLAETRGRPEAAEQAYLAALRLDADFAPARLNLARLYAATDRRADAERVLHDGLARQPDQGELAYSLGLLLAEQGRLAEAVARLGEAARLLPDRPRVRYNHALALQQAGRRREAEEGLLAAHELAPDDPAYLYALAVLYAQDRRWEAAVGWAERLVSLLPDDARARQLLAQLRASARRERR